MATSTPVAFVREKIYLPQYACRKCNALHDLLMRRCPDCGGKYTIRASRKAAAAETLAITAATSSVLAVEADVPRTACGIASVDNVFGGGLADGSVNMCWGLGGSGKSTLFAQIAGRKEIGLALLMQSEQPQSVVMSTLARLHAKRAGFDVVATADPDLAIRIAESKPYRLLIVDSLQEFADGGHSINRVRTVGRNFIRLARRTGATMLIVSHSIGTGKQASGEYNVHGVDATYEVTGDLGDEHGPRYFRVRKNRFGSSGRVARFRMGDHGLEEWPEEKRVDAAPSPPKDNSFNRRARPKRPVAR